MNDDADTTIDGSTTAAPRAMRGPKPLMEMTAGERERADAIDVRCLDLCIGMLERVNGVRITVFSLSVNQRNWLSCRHSKKTRPWKASSES
jgi:hypothetical protein